MRKNSKNKKPTVKPSKTASYLVLHPNPDAVRQEHIKKYKSQLRSHGTQSGKIRQFEEVECHEYRIWFEAQFDTEQKELVKLRQKAAELELIVEATQDYREMKRCSLKVAFQTVSNAIETCQLDEVMLAAKKEYDEKNPQEVFGEEDNRDNAFDDFFESFFGGGNDDDGPFKRESRTDDRQSISEFPKQARESAAHDYAKSLYLNLVSKLHPDSSSEFSVQHQELWHELQQAYKILDIVKLESLVKMVTGQKPVGFDLYIVPVGEIVGMTADLARKNRQLSRFAARLRCDPAWDFLKIKKNQRLLRATRERIAREMRSTEHEYIMQINHLQHIVNAWSQPKKIRSRSHFPASHLR